MSKKQKIISFVFFMIFALGGFLWIGKSTLMNGEGTPEDAVYYYGKRLENIKEEESRFKKESSVFKFHDGDWAVYIFTNERGDVSAALCDYYDFFGSPYYWCKQTIDYGGVDGADLSTARTNYKNHEYEIIKSVGLTNETTQDENIKTEKFSFNSEEYIFICYV